MARLTVYEKTSPIKRITLQTSFCAPFPVDDATSIELLVKDKDPATADVPGGDDADIDGKQVLIRLTLGTELALDPDADGSNHILTAQFVGGDLPDVGVYEWRLDRLDGTNRTVVLAPDTFEILDL